MDLSDRVGRPVDDTFGAVSPELVSALRTAVESGVRTTRAEGVVRNGARSFPIGLNTTVTAEPSNGAEPEEMRSATAIFQDITSQKRLDTLHRRTQRLEAVAELSASLAHEIKNPLASIRSAVEQLGHSRHATPDEQTLSKLIVRESDRLSRLLSEFLDFARVRVSRIQRLDVGRLVRGASALAEAHPDRPADVRLRLIVGDGVGEIDGDEDVLHRALFNLVLNAVQASPPAGEVVVDVTPVREGEAPAGVKLAGGGVSVRIADDGPGIPAEVRDRMFDPFFTTRPGGTGLGLAVVHRAVESHAGFVFVDSDEGSGTRMTVLLPREHEQPGEAT
jgi:signal transduction histidine kinase